MKRIATFLFVLSFATVYAQENLEYQKPPKEILDLVDVQLAPSVLMDDAKNYMLMRSRNTFPSIAELSETELRLAGLRINPKTNIGSRVTYYNKLEVMNLKAKDKTTTEVSGLPANPRLANFTWSPDQTKIAFTHTSEDGVELWVLDVAGSKATKLTDATLNANMRDVINWFEDSESMIVKMLPKSREALIDTKTAVPTGPKISSNDGTKAPNRTYQDLLKNQIDEHNFEQLALSELYQVDLSGNATKWKDVDMYRSISFSPDGSHVLVSTVGKPFSYLVTYSRFPTTTTVYKANGELVAVVNEQPLAEDLPKGRMSTFPGKRSFNWRADKPATLYYVQALDGGNQDNEVEFRDELYELEAPFTGEGNPLLKTKNRFNRVFWGDSRIAVAYDYWWNSRTIRAYKFNPSNPAEQPLIIEDRNYQDIYSDPGDFVTERNEMGSEVLALKKGNAFLIGDGYTAKGQFPFVDQINLSSLKKTRLYESEYTDKLERIQDYSLSSNQLLVRIEAQSEFPNYYFRNLKKNNLTQITSFENPFKSLADIHKEVIKYKRDDGIDLSGTLYLPAGYDKDSPEKLPMLLWAYPREYKDKSSAGQVRTNPNRFTAPYYGSPIFWVARGYAVLDGAEFPIVGEGDEEPNDTFRKQLVANAKAAIDAVNEMGYIDPNRVGVGGHSYGAFMVANLLSHSDLFAAGIARSGAYNRTLTPFGFQSEERTYWEAPEVYYTMSPFMHAEKMKTPLLLIHGEADNNSGTYPMQSERYFNALKGLGATVRLVMLPKESHGYRGKESVLHMLWEQDQWLEKYVKGAGKEPASE